MTPTRPPRSNATPKDMTERKLLGASQTSNKVPGQLHVGGINGSHNRRPPAQVAGGPSFPAYLTLLLRNALLKKSVAFALAGSFSVFTRKPMALVQAAGSLKPTALALV